MARKFTYSDVNPWKIVNHQGKTLRDHEGKQLTGLSGPAAAYALILKYGGIAVRA